MLKDYEKIRTLNYKKDFTLKNIQSILHLLGNPQDLLKVIHIAGTKGKTSTAAYLSKLLELSGIKAIGLYTSPHLISPVERIQISGKVISQEDLTLYSETVESLAKKNSISLTYFEVVTAAAFLYFKEKRCNYVILETGLGGRLDATNVVNPMVSVITTLDKDHTAILGKNIFKIAYEKLGILKKRVPYFVGLQKPAVFIFCKIMGWFKKARFRKNIKFQVVKNQSSFLLQNREFQINFHGPFYGIENFILALSVAKELRFSLPFVFDFTHQVPGRFESYPNQGGVIILDGAHNPIAASKLRQSLQLSYPGIKWIFVLNTFPDKDFQGMVKEFIPFSKEFIIIDKPGYAGEEIAQFLSQQKAPFSKKSMDEFFFQPGLFYCVTGSFYLIGDFKEKMN